MDNIEIVIKISEKEYDVIKENKYGVFSGHIFETIRNGRPLSEYIDDCIRRSDIGLTDFEIVMCNGNYKEALKMLLTKIEKAPPVNPQPKTGHWIEHKSNGALYIKCSECSCYFREKLLPINNYCPYCGIKMQEEKKE